MEYRRPLLLAALQALYEGKDGAGAAAAAETGAPTSTPTATSSAAVQREAA
jgi:hypothetical protein